MNQVEETRSIYGYTYVVVMTQMGHRCGYVGISKSHPLHGVKYSDPHPALKRSLVEKTPIGDRGIIPLVIDAFRHDDDKDCVSPDVYFDVHGGITYSDSLNDYPIANDGSRWWFGFDCSHLGDAPDLQWLRDHGNEDDLHYREKYFSAFDGHVWTRAEVNDQCVHLATQLFEVEKLSKKPPDPKKTLIGGLDIEFP